MGTVIVRYAEMALKSKPVRRRFERLLLKNIRAVLGSTPHEIRRERGRIFVDTREVKAASKKLSRLPGVVSVSPAIRVSADLDTIVAKAVEIAKRFIRAGDTFAVRTSRKGTHPFTSREVNELAGRGILSAVKGARVNLSSPTHRIFIEVRGSDAYIFKEVVKGVGGLPVGSQGSVLVAFSGTRRDSNTAFLMLKRGCFLKLLSFFETRGALRKAVSAARKLLKHHPELELFAVPFSEVQKSIQKVPRRFKFYIHRRAVIRAAELVLKRVRAEAMVFADGARLLSTHGLTSLGDVDRTSEIPVLRPLLGMEMKNLALKVQVSETRRIKLGVTLPSEKKLREIVKKSIPRDMLQRAVKRMKTIQLMAEK
jgi:thiamine biosynthesis protein ThiI